MFLESLKFGKQCNKGDQQEGKVEKEVKRGMIEGLFYGIPMRNK